MPEKKLKVWLNGRFIDYDKATVHILTHSLQYGSGIFEGIRAYDTERGPAIFRLADHIRRFMNSARIHSMNLGYDEDALSGACIDLVRANRLESCYIRPFAFYDDARIGLSTVGKKISVFIGALPYGQYFEGKRDKGIRCMISSWRRINSNILPVEAKASGNYLNSILASNEAKNYGFDEAILISRDGYVAEGPGENIFLVKDHKLITPDTSADILLGITRDSLMRIAEAAGIEVVEREVHREELLTADEVFFSGTAAEITPVTRIDGVVVSGGKAGSITTLLAQKYYDVVRGKDEDFVDWLTFIA
ncbi:MAG: branched-chain amino acid transaminase [Candidatus Marsarchaeota archaeon]|jgi:branched-chain amino acid aminotransferase|nr:branched-chain amino acid transaminase [Candidatus Marsarchaeota archaeon]